jgi:serine/threonine-protein kinase
VLPKDRAERCLRKQQELARAGKKVTLLKLMVADGLLTRTQALVLGRAPLEKVQPFPNYRLLRRVDEGGMALVYEASYEPLDARVALKILLTEYGLEERFQKRFEREAKLLLLFDHPNIVEGRDFCVEDGVCFYAMGFVDGVSVLDLIEQDVELTEGFALHVACQIGEAMEHMDEKGVVHRDIKPDNFVVDSEGTARIIDFGLAKIVKGMREDTAEATTVGTVEYMSPEQAKGEASVDIRSDIYSLGASIYHMVTGRLPFEGDQHEIMRGHVLEDLRFPASGRRVSPPVQMIIHKAMAKDRGERYATSRELVDDIRAVAGDLIENRGPVPDAIGRTGIEVAPIPSAGDDEPKTTQPPLPKLQSSRGRPGNRAPGPGRRRRRR